jgi:hypothetical protein
MTITMRPRATLEEVEKSCREIRGFHAVGRRLLRGRPGNKAKRGAGTISELAADIGWSVTKLCKAQTFAASYDADDVDALCAALRRHRPHLATAHVGILVTIKDAKVRKRLQHLCIKEDWSKDRLESEVLNCLGPRRFGGRYRVLQDDPADLLRQLDAVTLSWLRWEQVASGQRPKGRGNKNLLPRLPKSIREQVCTIGGLMNRLREAIAEKLPRIRAKRLAGASDSA